MDTVYTVYISIYLKGQNSLVGVTRYRLDTSGLELRWGQETFSSPHRSRPVLGPTQPSVQWAPELFPRGTPARKKCRQPLYILHIFIHVLCNIMCSSYMSGIYTSDLIDPCCMHSPILYTDCARFEVLTAVLQNIEVLWDVMLC